MATSEKPTTASVPIVRRTTRPVNVARSASVMAAGTLASRLLGLLKVMLIAYALGALGPLSSIFEASNTLPNLLYLMLAGGVFNVVLVPQIVKASRLPDRGSDYLSRLLTLGVFALLILTVLFTLMAGPLMATLTQFRGSQLTLATHFAIWLLPQIFFYGLYALLGQILNAHDRFGAYMWAPVLNNVIAIAGLGVFFWAWGTNRSGEHTVQSWAGEQTLVLAGTTTLGVVLQALVLILPVARLGLDLRPRWGWRGMGLGTTGRIAGWALGTMVIGQLSYLLITWVGTAATAGGGDVPGIFVFNRASDIYILPHSIVVLSIATILFNRMTRAASSGNQEALHEAVSRLVRTVGVITVFFGAVLLVLSGQIGVLLAGGRQQDAPSVGLAIAILAVSSPFLSLNFMFNRVFYATEDARTPFILQSVLVVFGIGTALITLTFPKSVLIFALLTTVALGNVLSPLLSGTMLRRRIGDVGLAHIVRSHVQFLMAAAAAAVAGALVLVMLGGMGTPTGNVEPFAWRNPGTALVTMAVVGSAMGAVYLLGLRMMRVRELEDLLRPLLSRFGRFFPAALTSFLLPATRHGDRLGSDHGEISRVDSSMPAKTPLEEETLANSIDVGSVLGGRYQVTGHVLASAEGDLVLDGTDQVLGRPVSIVIAAAENVENLTQSSREVATGNRKAAFHILDLGVGDGGTYLIASKATPTDLLNLLVPPAPYVEPHFTDALGIEIFGSARPPASFTGPYEYVYEDNTPVERTTLSEDRHISSQQEQNLDHQVSTDVHPESTVHLRDPLLPEASGQPHPGAQPPKVTLWDESAPLANEKPATAMVASAADQQAASVTAAIDSVPPENGGVEPPQRRASTFPTHARNTDLPIAAGSAVERPAPATAEPEFNDDEENQPHSGRWLILAVLVAVLGIVMIAVASQIGTLFNQLPPAAISTSGSPSVTAEKGSPATPVVAPVPVSVTRIIGGGDPGLSRDEDGNLGNLIDGNPSTVWRSLQFALPNFGRLAQSMALVIELREPATIKSVTITQAGGSGGSFELLANDQPSLVGARSIGVGSFTGPEITVVPAEQSNPAKYLIVNFTELPRLRSTTLPNLPFGLRISDITIK